MNQQEENERPFKGTPTRSATCRESFRSDPRSVAEVRHWARGALRKWGCPESDVAVAVLLCSEMAANAVEHAQADGELFDVALAVDAGECHIEVADRSPVPPKRLYPTSDDENGRGLQLIAALSSGYGHCYKSGGGKAVWARMTLDSCGAVAPARRDLLRNTGR